MFFNREKDTPMGEYDCCNCGEAFHLHEPPFDGVALLSAILAVNLTSLVWLKC